MRQSRGDVPETGRVGKDDTAARGDNAETGWPLDQQFRNNARRRDPAIRDITGFMGGAAWVRPNEAELKANQEHRPISKNKPRGMIAAPRSTGPRLMGGRFLGRIVAELARGNPFGGTPRPGFPGGKTGNLSAENPWFLAFLNKPLPRVRRFCANENLIAR